MIEIILWYISPLLALAGLFGLSWLMAKYITKRILVGEKDPSDEFENLVYTSGYHDGYEDGYEDGLNEGLKDD